MEFYIDFLICLRRRQPWSGVAHQSSPLGYVPLAQVLATSLVDSKKHAFNRQRLSVTNNRQQNNKATKQQTLTKTTAAAEALYKALTCSRDRC